MTPREFVTTVLGVAASGGLVIGVVAFICWVFVSGFNLGQDKSRFINRCTRAGVDAGTCAALW